MKHLIILLLFVPIVGYSQFGIGVHSETGVTHAGIGETFKTGYGASVHYKWLSLRAGTLFTDYSYLSLNARMKDPENPGLYGSLSGGMFMLSGIANPSAGISMGYIYKTMEFNLAYKFVFASNAGAVLSLSVGFIVFSD